MPARNEEADSEAKSLQAQARALGDPTRHGIWRYVLDAGRPVGVAELTAETALNHNAVRQHLAKLVAAGLLTEEAQATGAPGRPALYYRPVPGASVAWSGSDTSAELALWLLEMLRTGRTPEDVGRAAGRSRMATSRGRRQEPTAALLRETARLGFAPTCVRSGPNSDIVFEHCPFATAAAADPSIVCSLHKGFAEGALEALGGSVEVDHLEVHEPEQAGCVLHLREPGPA